uniref:Centrosomal protein of 162 kDa n=2 Tax=Macrostomum lignano TaxID=282301 RepID=A0A1I8GGS6_9PLAT
QQQQQQQQKKQQLQLGDQKSVQEISNALSKLRSEKTDLLAQCRKQQARIGHLGSQLAECQTEREAADTAAEQLRYELSAQARHHSTESAGLKRRLQELEAQLDESQREADEYYKANIEAGRLAERLQQEVLVLRSAAGSAGGEQQQQRPGEVNFGAQELYIQQLQDEIAGLRDRMRAKQLYGDDEAEAGNESEQVSRLRAKLKMAANQIKKLAQENQALVDLSNRLRAELNTGNRGQQRPSAQASRYKPSAGSATAQHQGEPIGLESHSRRAVKDAVGDMTSKLAQLERMQYYLTREELARQNSQQQSQRNQQQ